MLFRILVLFMIASICAGGVSANVAPLNKSDYFIKFVPTGETIQVGKPLSFTPDNNAKYFLEHNYVTGQDYVYRITIYSNDYVTSRGISIGDSADRVRECYGEPNRYSGSRSHYKWFSYIEPNEVLKVHFYLDKETEKVIAINWGILPVGTPPMILSSDGEYY